MARVTFRTILNGRIIGAGSFDYPDDAGTVVQAHRLERFEYKQEGWGEPGAGLDAVKHFSYVRGDDLHACKLVFRIVVGDRRLDAAVGTSHAGKDALIDATASFVGELRAPGKLEVILVSDSQFGAEKPVAAPVAAPVGPVALPSADDDADDSCAVKNVVFTGDIFAAAMSRLNSESVLTFLGEMIETISEKTAGTELGVNNQLDVLRREILLRILNVESGQGATNGQLAALGGRVDRLDDTGAVTSTRVNSLTEVVDKLRHDLVLLKQGEETGEINITQILQQIGELKEKVQILRELSTSLDDGELDQIKSLLLQLLQNTNVQAILAKTKIVINDRQFELDRLLQILVQSDRIRNIQFVYSTTDISGAIVMLVDGTAAVFSCRRQENESRDVSYEFSTGDWKGIGASFKMAFKRRERTFMVCGKPVTHAAYDAHMTSNIVFNLCCRFTADAA